jgi:peptide/histidine transporter 3/4
MWNVMDGIKQAVSKFGIEDRSEASSLVSDRRTTRRDLCFRLLKRKGAVLVLVWSFCGLFTLNFIMSGNNRERNFLSFIELHVSPLMVMAMCTFLYPFFGLLADLWCGRYEMIKWSLRALWASFILYCLAEVLLKSVHLTKKQFQHSRYILGLVAYVIISLGLGGFLANIFQLGIDQLVDAASCEIMLFLRWFSWLWLLNATLQALSQSCLCADYEVVGTFVLPALMTLAVVMDVLFNHWLVKEPPRSSPFLLIYKVFRYAMKNKYPRLRSAFTYWEDKPYTRIDLAKEKYGGPFTTEQVEDIKTFFRIVSIIVSSAFFVGVYLSIYPAYDKVWCHLKDEDFVYYSEASCGLFVKNCLSRISVHYSGHCIVIVAVPLFEFILYPLLERCCTTVSLRKVSVGLCIITLSLGACTAIEFVANHQNIAANGTTSCPLTGQPQCNTLPLDYKWIAFPFIASSIGQFLLLTSAGEFLCSQSPYSLKGFLFGLAYGCTGFFAILGYGMMQLIAKIAVKWAPSSHGCLSWYLLMALLFILGTLCIFFAVLKCYKKRTRDDDDDY